MNQRLRRIVAPFQAEFWGGTQDEDGVVRATEQITLAADDGVLVFEPNATFPLEVGTTSGAKTLVQLRMFGRLARWPYGCDAIYLLALKSDDRFGEPTPYVGPKFMSWTEEPPCRRNLVTMLDGRIIDPLQPEQLTLLA